MLTRLPLYSWSSARMLTLWLLLRQSLAVDISLAALLGDNIYNFGELLLHPIVRSYPPPASSGLCYLSDVQCAKGTD